MLKIHCFFLLLLSTLESICDAECPPRWLSFQNSCYKLSDFFEFYENHQIHCEDQGATLVSILSLEENQFVFDQVALGHTPWLGIHLRDSFSYDWIWDDGTPLGYTNWFENGFFTESRSGRECAYMSSYDGTWFSNIW